MISGHHQKCCQGYTLIELMIAAALSIFIVSILNGTLVKTAKFMEEIKATGNLLQTGQYLASFLENEVSMAGFYGEFDRSAILDAGNTDICQTLTRKIITKAIPYVITGQNNVVEDYRLCGNEYVKDGTDVLLVRKVSVEKLKPNAKLKSGEFYIQSMANSFDVLFGSGSTAANKINTVSVRRWQQTIYYLSKDNVFKRRRYLKGRYAPAEPLAVGVYDFQLEYGLRKTAFVGDCVLSNDLDFVVAPLSLAQWQKVVAVKVYLLLKDSWRGSDQPKITLNYANHQVEIAKGETNKLLEFTVPIMNALQKN
jgi:type IV pilus assembly protein PilW